MWKLSLLLDLSVLEPLCLLSTVAEHVFIPKRFTLCSQEQLSAIQRFWVCCACLRLQKSVLKSFTFQPVPVWSCLTWCNPHPGYHGTLSSFNCVWRSPLKCEKTSIFWSWACFSVAAHWRNIFIPGYCWNILWKETKSWRISRGILSEPIN